jgi:hypothetical protein
MSGGPQTSDDQTALVSQTEQSVSAPLDQSEQVRELTHEEFDPKGTLALILVYFAILAVMWVFMYFVEFLGNDLVVVG